MNFYSWTDDAIESDEISFGPTAADSADIALAQSLAESGSAWPDTASAACIIRPKAKRVVQLFMSGAASQCDTFDYKPRLHRAQRAEVRSRRQGRAVPKQSRSRDGEPVGMEAARAVRQMGQQPNAASRLVRRRHGFCALDDFEVQCARPRDLHAEHRLRAARFPIHGRMDFVRPGQHEQQSADVRRAAGFTRLRAQRARQLDRRIPAGRASGHDDSRQQRESDLRSVSSEERVFHHAAKREPTRFAC